MQTLAPQPVTLLATSSATAAATATTTATAPAYLRVRLGPHEYGIDAAAIHEVRAFEVPPDALRAQDTAPTALTNGKTSSTGPACLLGVLNLRGRIVPIVDLRRLMGCGATVADAYTALVVVKHGNRWVGAVVDAAGEIAPGQPGLKEIDVQGLLADPALALG